jgi:hypothetical protein
MADRLAYGEYIGGLVLTADPSTMTTSLSELSVRRATISW